MHIENMPFATLRQGEKYDKRYLTALRWHQDGLGSMRLTDEGLPTSAEITAVKDDAANSRLDLYFQEIPALRADLAKQARRRSRLAVRKRKTPTPKKDETGLLRQCEVHWTDNGMTTRRTVAIVRFHVAKVGTMTLQGPLLPRAIHLETDVIVDVVSIVDCLSGSPLKKMPEVETKLVPLLRRPAVASACIGGLWLSHNYLLAAIIM